MVPRIIPFVILIVASMGPRATESVQKSSSACALDRTDFGHYERVEISAISISLHLKNPSAYQQCSNILRMDVFIISTETNQLVRTVEDIQSSIIFIDHLDSNKNYSITLQLANHRDSRIFPTYIFQTLPQFDRSSVSLTANELLVVDQIESRILPHTHIFIVTIPNHLQQSNIHGQVTLSYIDHGKQMEYHQLIKPLDQNKISRIGRVSRKAIFYSFELPFGTESSIEYSSTLQLYFVNDPRQSIVYRSGMFKPPSPIAVDFFLPINTNDSGRSLQILLENICPMYIEAKVMIYDDDLEKKLVTRSQCDIGKNYTTESDISNGRCSIIIKDLQPEHNYTLAVRSTCPITSSFSASSHYVFYDRARLFSFQTPTGSPDLLPLRLSFDAQKKILSWHFVTINKSVKSSTPYLGPDFFYELLTRSNENWTLIYRGNETFYQIPSEIFNADNVTFQIFIGNRYGRQSNYSGQFDLNIQTLNSLNNRRQTVIFTVLFSFLLLLLIFAFLFVGYYVRNKTFYGKLKKKYYRNDPMSDKELEHLRSMTHPSMLKDNILYTWNHTPTNIDVNKLPKIERVLIKLDHLLGKGAFGEVYAGRFRENQPIAIKTLLSSASDAQRLDFLKEAIIMNQFDHQHIVHLLGVCFHHDQQPQFLVLELMNKGDLQNYLRSSRPNQNREQCRLSYDACLDIARQIADGACYLEQHGYVHRDLAARNCLVSSPDNADDNVIVKIGDFGLARMLSNQDYYRKTGEALLPVRWMAPESLLDAIFTSNSDIWSFGIVLWEIITLGQVPYSPLNNQQVVSLITTTRGTLEKPNHCTNALYELMLLCWNYVPEQRIHFDEIRSNLEQMLLDPKKEQPSSWFIFDHSSSTARITLDSVISHIEPPNSISLEGSDTGECRSSTSGCFSSMTESISPAHHSANSHFPSYKLRLIDDTTSNDFADEDNHSDIMKRSLQ